jgi:hypothetical protein
MRSIFEKLKMNKKEKKKIPDQISVNFFSEVR